jgi:hypothetical protein
MECKVKIGCAYEPKWFEIRQTQGTYCGKNVPLDFDGMWLQDRLIGKKLRRQWGGKIAVTGFFSFVGAWLFYVYGGF